jgi:hypothetical protein
VIESATSSAPRRSRMTVRWTRVTAALAIVLLCPLLAMWLFEPWYFAREMSRDNPHLNVTPASLQDRSTSLLAPARLQCFEFVFQVPWDQIKSRKDSRSVAIISFKNGPTIMTFDPADLSDLSNSTRAQTKRIEKVFGSRAMSSNYDWMATELAATPDQIHFWNRYGNVRTAVLLGLKQIEVLDSTAIYRNGNEELKGFQFGNPAVDSRVTLDLYDVNNRRYQLVIASPSKAARTFSQADINAIVASMRPIPHS